MNARGTMNKHPGVGSVTGRGCDRSPNYCTSPRHLMSWSNSQAPWKAPSLSWTSKWKTLNNQLIHAVDIGLRTSNETGHSPTLHRQWTQVSRFSRPCHETRLITLRFDLPIAPLQKYGASVGQSSGHFSHDFSNFWTHPGSDLYSSRDRSPMASKRTCLAMMPIIIQ